MPGLFPASGRQSPPRSVGGVGKPYELVIFDCDGVLVDSGRLVVSVDALVLASMGWDLSEEEIVRRFVGRPHEDMTEQLSLLAAAWRHGV